MPDWLRLNSPSKMFIREDCFRSCASNSMMRALCKATHSSTSSAAESEEHGVRGGRLGVSGNVDIEGDVDTAPERGVWGTGGPPRGVKARGTGTSVAEGPAAEMVGAVGRANFRSRAAAHGERGVCKGCGISGVCTTLQPQKVLRRALGGPSA